MIQKQDWKWFGNAGHLCVGAHCRFHLCTEIGQYVVSTVGQYWPQEAVREIFANSRGVTLEGKGDARERDYMTKVGYEEIGCGRTYETMVFNVTGHCNSPECRCGLPLIDGQELDCEGYNSAADATAGHMAMCEKWANR